MDLVTGVVHKFVPAWSWVVRPPRTPTFASSSCNPVSLHFHRHCSWSPPVRGNASSVTAFAKKRSKNDNATENPHADDGYEGDGDGDGDGDGMIDFFDDDVITDDEDDDGDFLDDFETEDADLYAGDGGEGGGISLAGTWWDEEAFSLAEEVSASFDGDLKIYAFKTLANLTIRVRIENLLTRYGSPSMMDIEAFSVAYRTRLDEAESAGRIPQSTSLEVSSPGVERVVRIPEDLERFKDRPMYVKYISDGDMTTLPQESDGVFRLISYDMELCECTWGIADVKINRQKAGKGRPLSKKQREWRLQTPFESLKLVRLYSDC